MLNAVTPTHAPGYLSHVGDNALAYANEENKRLLLAALAHMPQKLRQCTNLSQLDKPIVRDNCLVWSFSYKNYDAYGNHLDKDLSVYAMGHYIISYDPDTKLYTFRVLWDACSLFEPSRTSSYAINIRTQTKLFDIIQSAYNEGRTFWLTDKTLNENRKNKVLARKNAENLINKTLPNLP